jgi:hypothetical protein
MGNNLAGRAYPRPGRRRAGGLMWFVALYVTKVSIIKNQLSSSAIGM